MNALTKQLLAWMEIESTTGIEAAYLEALEHDLSSLGFAISRQVVAEHPPRWNLIATRKTPDFVFCTHVDTVPPFIPPKLEKGAVWGRGACDTKGGLAAMIAAWKKIRETAPDLADRTAFLLVVGEETDHVGAKAATRLDWQPRGILLGEPTLCEIAAAQKGVLKVNLASEGVAGHSAFPERGVSAVHRLLDTLDNLRTTDWPTDDVMGPTTFNIGQIHGGVADNVFAPSAHANVMFRAVCNTQRLLSLVQECLTDSVQIVETIHAQPQHFTPPPDMPTTVVPFNSDAEWLRTLGPVWLAGPGDIRLAHSVEERIGLDEIDDGVRFYVEALQRLADQSA